VVTAANLPLYLCCSLALIVLWRRGMVRGALLGSAVLGVLFVVFAFIGIGHEPLVLGLGLIAAGLPLYAFMRLRRRPQAVRAPTP
jgi:APA family basic amino acid/polyamine antiporter